MAKIAGNEIRPGTLIDFDGGLWIAVKTQAVKPGKGGAYNQVELKNIINGTKLNQRFRSDETVDEIYLEKKDYQFLYAEGEMLVFMDTNTYEQIELQKEFVGERSQFLTDGMKVMVTSYEERPLGIQLPLQVVLTVAEADPVMKGGTAAPSYKNAVLENGLKTLVPPFIDAGTKIVVSTEDGSYVKRAEI
jgi:elongation factor P